LCRIRNNFSNIAKYINPIPLLDIYGDSMFKYELNRDLYVFSYYSTMVSKVRAAHILVKGEGKAKEIFEKINTGESFAELAKKFSECPSRKRGGDLGWFGRGQMVREFEKAAFEGEKGSVVGPVKTQFGWHLIKVMDKK